jgi:hypothetical protein
LLYQLKIGEKQGKFTLFIVTFDSLCEFKIMSENMNPNHLNEADNSEELNTAATEAVVENVNPNVNAPVEETPAAEIQHSNNDVPVAQTEPIISEPVTTEIAVETIEMSEEEKELEEVEDAPDFSSLTKEQLVDAAVTAVKEKDAVEATRIIKAVKPLLDHLLQEEFNQALQKFIEDGAEKDDFAFKTDNLREVFNTAAKELKQKKSDEKARQEAEKMANLKKKEAILDQIKELTETEETKDSLKKLKELQTEWKNVKNVSKEHVERLWENYHVLIHKFYDRLSMFNELKDLDRRKNLDQKIDLTKKVTELALEPSIKKALIMLKKYQEDWKVIGPVPQESNEDIWARFKQECDKIFEMIRAFQVEADKKREDNLAAKKELLVKALEFSNYHTTRIKEWMEKSTAVNQLMEDWKAIGMVPMKFRETIWNDFKNARNQFFTNKNNFFKQLHAERNDNLKAKTALCEKAESISAAPVDLNRQTEEIKKLQEEWKKIGPVHEKISDAIWKRFRGACDAFFAKKAEHYSGQIEEQKKNLEVKNALIAKLEELYNKEDGANIIHELKAVQDEWNNTGFVPMNAKEAVSKKYSELNDKVFQKFRQANNELREMKEKSHLEALMGSPNGLMKVKREEKFLQDKIRGLKSDMETWDNNLGFFAKSKGDNPMVDQIKGKINDAQRQISQLQDKLKQVRIFIKQNETQKA